LNLTVLGSGLVAAVALHLPPVAAIGVLAYAAMVAWDAMGSSAPKPTTTPEPDLPEPSRVADPDIRSLVVDLLRARAERAQVIGDTPDSVRTHLGSALASVSDLERNAAALIARAEDLQKWLATQDRSTVDADLARLADLAARTRDASARSEYEQAIEARRDQLRALEDVVSARDRILANLSRIAATLGSLPPRLVHMRALDAEALDTVGTDVSRDLQGLNQDVRLFEQTLQSLKEGMR
jgi:DNA repair exonuclease SbcCD ATPase subunit